MLKRQSKVLSTALIFVFCMSFMFAGFAAPQAAEAASTYTAVSVPVLQSNTAGQNLGIIKVSVDNCAAIKAGDVLTISLPSDITLPANADTAATRTTNAAVLTAASTATVATAAAAAAETAGLTGTGTALAAGGIDGITGTGPLTAALIASAEGPAINASAKAYGAPGSAKAAADAVYDGSTVWGAVYAKAIAAGDTAATATKVANAAIAALKGDAGVIGVWTATDIAVAASGYYKVEVVAPTLLPSTNPNGLAAPVINAGVNNAGAAVVTSTRNSIDITMNATGTPNPGELYIYMYNVNVGSLEGDVTARILAPANSAFASGSVVVGQSTTGRGTTVASVLSEKSFGTSGLTFNPLAVPPQLGTDVISVTETRPGTLAAGEVIKVKLPNGFTWSAIGGGTQSWGWAGADPTVARDLADQRILNVTVTGANFPSAAGGLAGRVNFRAGIAVDDSIARTGDVTVRVYSDLGNVTEQDIVIGKYVNYGVEVKEGTKKEIIAGKHDQKIGDFIMEENIAGSLIPNRMVKMTLPTGVKWSGDYDATAPASGLPLPPAAQSGNLTLAAYTTADNYATLRTMVNPPAAGTATKSKFKFENLKVDVAPDFTGPITITFSGEAGVTGEVEVANVTPAVELKAENTTKVRIGEQNQELGTLLITETKRENIKLVTPPIHVWGGQTAPATPAVAGSNAGQIAITLPTGAEWSAGYPTVEVTEGDLVLKTNEMSKTAGTLIIPVKSESTKPSTIKVSGLKATINRTVPEGDFKVGVTGLAINETGGKVGNQDLAFPQYENIKVVLANCVTPAPGEGTEGAGAGEFRIDSNIYYVAGVAKVMDVAPYIKGDRTYVPMRYLGEILGAEVVWDDAARTVTLTKGEDVVVFTIGSTTYTVNGEAKTADVAPEITNDRTMLPARFVAEAFGSVVGWDPGTRTVLISK